MTKPDDLSNIIADLQRQRRDLEAQLDETSRSRISTAQVVEKIIDIKQRAAEIRRGITEPDESR